MRQRLLTATLGALLMAVPSCSHNKGGSVVIRHEKEVYWTATKGTTGFTIVADYMDGTHFKYVYVPMGEDSEKNGVAFAVIKRPSESDKAYQFDVTSQELPWRHKAHKLTFGPEPTICSPKVLGSGGLDYCSLPKTEAMMHYFGKYSQKIPLTQILENYANGEPLKAHMGRE